MRQINRGKIENDTYIKHVRFSSAVLWKSKELSLPIEEMIKIRKNKVKKLHFVDHTKNETWEFDSEDIARHSRYKIEGQELQYYFNIAMRKVIKDA